jgi:hypothetical protein
MTLTPATIKSLTAGIERAATTANDLRSVAGGLPAEIGFGAKVQHSTSLRDASIALVETGDLARDTAPEATLLADRLREHASLLAEIDGVHAAVSGAAAVSDLATATTRPASLDGAIKTAQKGVKLLEGAVEQSDTYPAAQRVGMTEALSRLDEAIARIESVGEPGATIGAWQSTELHSAGLDLLAARDHVRTLGDDGVKVASDLAGAFFDTTSASGAYRLVEHAPSAATGMPGRADAITQVADHADAAATYLQIRANHPDIARVPN